MFLREFMFFVSYFITPTATAYKHTEKITLDYTIMLYPAGSVEWVDDDGTGVMRRSESAAKSREGMTVANRIEFRNSLRLELNFN